MANKKRAIGAIIKLDGENAFKSSVKNCRSSLAAMHSSLKNIQASYAGNANSLEALSAVQEKYAEMQSTAKEQVEKMSTAYEKSREAQQKTKETMLQMLEAYKKAEESLHEMKDSGEASADAINQQQEAADKAYQSYLDYSEQVEKCGSRTAYFQKALEDAKAAEREAGSEVDRYARYIEEARESADGCSHSINEFGEAVSESGEAADAAGGAMNVFAGVVGGNIATAGIEKVCDWLKQGAKYAVEVGSGMESSLSKVQALSGATDAEMRELKATAEDLGRISKRFNAEDVSDAFGYMALADWNVRQQLAAIPGVINLATASEMDLAEASDMVTDYLTAFGLSAEYAGKMADMLAYAQSHSNATTAQFGEAYKNSAASLNAAGQSIQTVTALLEAYANQGRKGSEAGTSLSATMRDITSKMKDGAIQIGNTSIAVQDSNGDFRDLIDIMSDVEAATEGMGNAQRSAALSAVFTDDSIKGVNMVLQEGMDNVMGYREELENCDGAAEQMADTMSDNLQGAMDSASSAANGLGDAVYDYIKGPLTDMFDGIADGLNGITDAIQKQESELDLFIDQVEKANDKVQNTISKADTDYAEGMANAETVKYYIDIIEQARSKTELTEYETFQLNNAIETLSGTIPELNQYIGDTNKILELSASDFETLKDTMVQSYQEIIAAAIAAKRNAYVMAKAEAEIAKAQAQSALDESDKKVKEQKEKIKEIEKRQDEAKFNDFSGNYKLTKELNAANEEMTDYLQNQREATSELKKAEEQYSKTSETVEDFDSRSKELYEDYGLYVNQSGSLTTKIIEQAKADDEAAKASESLSDAVEDTAAAYIDAAGNIQSADVSAAIESQLTAAAQNVEDFKDSLKSAFSSFSLFGDTEGLMDIYTSSSKGQMEKNAQISLDIMGKYADELKSLSQRGLSDEFLSYLTEQGQSGLEYVHNLATWTSDAELQQFQKQFDEFSSYTSGTNEKVDDIMQAYTENIMEGVTDGYNAWYEFGIQSTQGLLDAIEQAKAAMQDENFSVDFTDAMKNVLTTGYSQIQEDRSRKQALRSEVQSDRGIGASMADLTIRPEIQNEVKVYLDSEDVSAAALKRQASSYRITGMRK